MKRINIWLVTCIFAVAVLVRIGDFNSLPIQAHPQRQTDTACVIHFFTNQSLNILQPRACLIRPKTNLQGLFFLEFPLYQWLAAIIQVIAQNQSLWLVRIFNLLLFSLAFWSLYAGCRNYFDEQLGLLSVLIFSWLPSGIFFFGTAIHPDVFMIATLFGSWFWLTQYLRDHRRQDFIFCLLCLSLSILTRPFAAICLPAWALLLWQNDKKKESVLCLLLPCLPYLLWTLYQRFFPEADHSWQLWTVHGQESLLLLETWKLLLFKNVSGEVLGKVVTLLSVGGLMTTFYRKDYSKLAFVLLYLLLIPFYWLVVPNGNLNHQYYAHVYIFPFIILTAYGLTCWSRQLEKHNFWRTFIIAAAIFLIVINGWRTSRYFYLPRVSNEEIALAQSIEKVVPANKKIMFLGEQPYTISLAYRQGWVTAPNGIDINNSEADISEILAHADYLVAPSFDGIFPLERLSVTSNLDLVADTPAGKIYQIQH